MKRSLLGMFAVAAIAAPALAAAGDMSVATFLARADALRAKGPMALFSSDYGVLKGEATAAGQAYAARLATERSQGRPSSCPPRGAKPSQDQWMQHLNSYPAASRPRVTLRAAMADYYMRTWPCH